MADQNDRNSHNVSEGRVSQSPAKIKGRVAQTPAKKPNASSSNQNQGGSGGSTGGKA